MPNDELKTRRNRKQITQGDVAFAFFVAGVIVPVFALGVFVVCVWIGIETFLDWFGYRLKQKR